MLAEVKKDCEETLNLTEQLFEHKAKIESEGNSLEGLIEQVQKLESENERQGDYTKALEVIPFHTHIRAR